MSVRSKAKRISLDQIQDIRYMWSCHVVGLLGTLVMNYSLPLNQFTIDGMKDALIDHFFDGFDPEWEEYGMWQWFENMNPSWFEIKNSDFRCNKLPKDFTEHEHTTS